MCFIDFLFGLHDSLHGFGVEICCLQEQWQVLTGALYSAMIPSCQFDMFFEWIFYMVTFLLIWCCLNCITSPCYILLFYRTYELFSLCNDSIFLQSEFWSYVSNVLFYFFFSEVVFLFRIIWSREGWYLALDSSVTFGLYRCENRKIGSDCGFHFLCVNGWILFYSYNVLKS